ncbi:MAG: lipocalin family protein [Tidjanibacter sp.]|nr:lipocalin family protein [Tidjanibacter sp.]
MEKRIVFIVLTIAAILTTIFVINGKTKEGKTFDRSTVTNVDLNRYTGRWYEIARFPHSFERGMTHTTANYSLLPDGSIKVVNAGRKANGQYKEAVGRARTTDTPGRLTVTFFIFPGEYNIMALDTVNYSYSMVGSRSKDYFWILARTPQLPKATLDALFDEATSRGYDLSELIMVEQ